MTRTGAKLDAEGGPFALLLDELVDMSSADRARFLDFVTVPSPILCQPPPYPVPTAALSCANCRPILCQPPPYPVPTVALSCSTAPISCANRRPILPTAALSCQPPPYPVNRRPILATAALSWQLPGCGPLSSGHVFC
ncbi:hypothetical protein T484DRAFT_1755216 [Baffinella frigidus]|nr:hypothetical protein T484DRAFT_1755216 [Cryptophyta sp. CCMP2293]